MFPKALLSVAALLAGAGLAHTLESSGSPDGGCALSCPFSKTIAATETATAESSGCCSQCSSCDCDGVVCVPGQCDCGCCCDTADCCADGVCLSKVCASTQTELALAKTSELTDAKPACCVSKETATAESGDKPACCLLKEAAEQATD